MALKWFSVMCVLVHLCCVYAIPGSLEDELAQASKICCNQGSSYGRQHSSDPESCSSSAPPSVPPHLGQLCALTVEHCCKEYIQKKKDCESGVNIATRTQRCDGTVGFAQVCCNECKRGTDAATRGMEGCNSTAGYSQDEMLAGDAFQQCCVKIVDRNKKKQMEILNQTSVRNGSPLRLPFQDNATSTTSTSTTAPDYPYRNRGPYKAFGFGIHCAPGYYLSRITEKCEDINECESGEADCGPNEHCINVVGGYTCNLGNSCPIGHRMTADHECVDVDECELAGHQSLCTRNADCVNTIGSFRCQCHVGFRSAPANEKVCVDVDECLESEYLCEHRCNNVWGGYKCSCSRGYRLNNDNRTCADVDECTEYKSKGLCMWQCVNKPGSYHCKCPSGYRLSEDMRSCIDIDECETGEAFCVSSKGINGDETDVCMNTRGSYRCHHISCPIGYKLYSTTINKYRCSKIDKVCPPADWECAHQPTTYSYNFITFVSQLYLPDGKVNIFTMQGPAWARLTFELRLVDVNTPPSVRDKAQIDAFLLTQTNQTAIVSLVKPIQGPQTLELELSMELYSGEIFGGVAVAKLFIVVSEYEF